jgi:hypothetical protein
MKIRSLIISSLLVSGLSLGLSASAQARDTHYSNALYSSDHGYSHPKHYRSRHHRGHYSRLNNYHRDRYRDRKNRHSSHRQHGDNHDRRDKRDRRDSHRHRS